MDELRSWLLSRLPELLVAHDVPGAVVAVHAGDEVVDVAAGVINNATGVAVTPDALFQVGSITKLWTTTLIMQLVEEGRLELDAPVRRHLPDFRLADPAAAATVTPRHLLSHVGGFEGDLFTDTGKGDESVARFVGTLGDTPQLFPPGAMFSYNNAGYAVLGRIVEVLRGRPFDECLRTLLARPLGVQRIAGDPYEAIRHRTAVGHIRTAPGAPLAPAPTWALPRSNAPAGSMLAMSARDLLVFARAHLRGGAGLLGHDSVKAMQERQVDLPDLGTPGGGWGLGWELYDAGGTLIGHDGGTIGQAAFLRLVPDRDVAVALLTNGGDALSVQRAIVPRLLRELAGVTPPPLPTPPPDPAPIDAARVLGDYSSRVGDLSVTRDAAGRVWLDETPKGIFTQLGRAPEPTELVTLRGDTLIARTADGGAHATYAFLGDDGTGRALFLHGGRATRRTGF